MKMILLFVGLVLVSETMSQDYFRKSDFIRLDCDAGNQYDEFSRAWYTRTMIKFDEPSYLETDFQYPKYRFLWMPSFDSVHLITIHFSDSVYATWKIAFDEGEDAWSNELDYSPIEYRTGSKSLEGTTYIQAWERLLSDLGFWNDNPMESCFWLGVTDGSDWLFEAKNKDRYKLINRSNPQDYSKYYLLGLFFFKAAGIEKDISDIY